VQPRHRATAHRIMPPRHRAPRRARRAHCALAPAEGELYSQGTWALDVQVAKLM